TIYFAFFNSPTWIAPVEHPHIELQVAVVGVFYCCQLFAEIQRCFQSLPSYRAVHFGAIAAQHLFRAWKIAANPIGGIASWRLILLATCIRVIGMTVGRNNYQKFLAQSARKVRAMMKASKSEKGFPVELVEKIRTYDATIARKGLYEKIFTLSGIICLVLILVLLEVTMWFRDDLREIANSEFKDWIEASFFSGKGYKRIILCLPWIILCALSHMLHPRPTAGGGKTDAILRKNKQI
ncbi:hypothetical protein CYMTET_13310, partial [Cymbomonas tetramitiformis]